MNFASTLLLALAMSTDAFAVAVGKGAALHKPRLTEAMRVGLIFGVVEAITPLIGWLLGRAAAPYIESWDHWVAFGLLLMLGAHMIWRSLQPAESGAGDEACARRGRQSVWALALAGLATSIDAMAVGISLAFIDASIVSTSVMIGLATMVMVTLGIMLGRVLKRLVGRWAELAGGVILILVGLSIVYEHLSL
ncbi:manganese efflux pump MntP family protein [Kerstersia similis]|uniref:manganese efflux pump MntP n=1 Tax=Kerstersia similis TaxID=206505 RepID=UPI0039EE7268